MKNFNLDYFTRKLKSSVKTKVKITKALAITLLMTGGLSMADITLPGNNTIRTGIATTESGTAIGDGSISTGENTTAVGTNSVATGSGFTREDYNRKKQELEGFIRDKKAKQDELANLKNEKSANDNLINDYNRQITALGDRLRAVETLTNRKDELLRNKESANTEKSRLEGELANKKNEYAPLLSVDKTKVEYLNLTKILEGLNWDKLTTGDSATKKRELANDLKTIVDEKFGSFSTRFDESKYEKIIDGYLNRQGSIQGTIEWLNDKKKNTVFKDGINPKIMKKFGKDYEWRKDHVTTKEYESEELALLRKSGYYPLDDTNKVKYFNKVANRLLLFEFSRNKLNKNNQFNGIYGVAANGNDFYLLKSRNGEDYKVDVYINGAGEVNDDFYFHSSKVSNYSSRLNIYFGYVGNNGYNFDEYSSASLRDVKELDSTYIGILYKGNHPKNGSIMYQYFNRIINEQDTVNPNLFSLAEIQGLLNMNTNIHKIYDNIDWTHDKSVIDLNDYKVKFEKAMNYSDKTKEWAELYKEIVEGTKNGTLSQDEISRKTVELMKKRDELNELRKDPDSQFENIEIVKNYDNIKYYMEYGKEDYDAFMNEWADRLNTGLRLYDQNDEIAIAYKTEIDRVIKELEDLDNQIKAQDGIINNADRDINNLGLTDEDNSLNDKKHEIENKLADARNKENELNGNISNKENEIRELDKTIKNANLGSIGLNSNATGKEAFASGDNSIAFGTNATVTGNRSVGIGIENTVNGVSSTALGDANTITGDKNIAVGVRHVVSGTGSSTVGDPNVIYGDNNHVYGNNNTVGLENAHKNDVFILGSNVNATSVGNAIILGNNSAAVENALSIGSAGKERKIVNVAEGLISNTSKESVNGSQLFALADGSSGDINIEGWKNKLGITNNSGGTPTNIIIKVGDGEKALTDGNKLEFINGVGTTAVIEGENNTPKIKYTVNVDNATIEVNGENKLAIKDNSISEGKLDQALRDKLARIGQANPGVAPELTKGSLAGDEFEIIGDGKLVDGGLTISLKDGSISKDKLNEELKGKIDAIDTKADKTEVDKKLNKDLSNFDDTNVDEVGKTKLITALNKDFNLENPTGAVATDRDLKTLRDDKANKNLDNISDLTDNAKTILTTALNEGSLDNPTGKFVTDTKIKEKLDLKLNKSDLVKASLMGNGITIDGTGKILDSNITLSITDGAITKEKLAETLKKEIDSKVSKEVMALALVSKANLDASNVDGENITKWREKLGITDNGEIIANPNGVSYVDENHNVISLGKDDIPVSIRNVALPVDDLDATNKFYVDNKVKEATHGVQSLVNNSVAMAHIPQVTGDRLFSFGVGAAYSGGKVGSFALGISGQDKSKRFVYKVSSGLSTDKKWNVGAGFSVSLGETGTTQNVTTVVDPKLESKLEQFENVTNDKFNEMAKRINELLDENNRLNAKIGTIKDSNKVSTEIRYVVDMFEFGKYKLNDYQKEKLMNIMSKVSRQSKLELYGYTDLVGEDKNNLGLGLNRAKEIAKFLASKGYSISVIRSRGYNEVRVDKGGNQALNRRVEIVVK